ncbi:MAG: hypothetical protein U1E50_15855 [Caulobacteraceae bacterium]
MTTKTSPFRVLSAAALSLTLIGVSAPVVTAPAFAAPAAACAGAGVVTRIEGEPAGLQIARGSTRVARPRVLEVLCVGDRVSVTGATRATLSLDGRGSVRVDAATPVTVAARAGAPSLAGNAYRAVNDQVMPDMKRMPWNVRLKGPEDDFAFALTSLAAGTQVMSPGPRALLVRVVGGTGPYRAVLTGPNGQVAGEVTARDGNIVLPSVNLAPGRYKITANDTAGAAITAEFTVAAKAAGTPGTYESISDPEVRAAATAAAIARADPSTRGFEAEQLLAEAPSNGLDRARVYALIEEYGAAE